MDNEEGQHQFLLNHNSLSCRSQDEHATYGSARAVSFDDDDDVEALLVVNGSDEGDDDNKETSQQQLPLFQLVAILSTAFSYGCILTTLFLITLPIECERIHATSTNKATPKSVALGVFVAIAGFTQLISPLVGKLSDTYEPPAATTSSPQQPETAEIGQRMPYLIVGGFLAVTGMMGQMLASNAALWIRYTFAFFFSMVGLNIQYAMMVALIPDQVPRAQTGIANGTLALLLVTGSIFGFGLFHTYLSQDIGSMYGLYTCIVIVTSVLTGTHAHDRDAELCALRMQRRSMRVGTTSLETKVKEPRTSSSHNQSAVTEPTSDPTHHGKHWRKKAKKVAKKAVRKAVKKAHEIVLPPALILKSMLDPFRKLNWSDVLKCYTIDVEKYHDFFIVTVSRLFYYCGMSVQTFFLYFVHDIIHVRNNPEAAVATLAILGQCSGALTCYPVGILSDRVLGGRRTPFVYFACAILGTATLVLVFATTLHQMVIFCLVLGAANGIYLTMDTSLAVDTLPDNMDLDSNSGSAQLLGVWGVAAFLGSALGPTISGPLLYLFGAKLASTAEQPQTDNNVVEEEYGLTGYAVILSLSSLYFLCSAFTLCFLRGTKNERSPTNT